MSTKSSKTTSSLLDGWNSPPNIVTYIRIALVIVFLALYVSAGVFFPQVAQSGTNTPLRWAAAIVFIVAASTDKLDGWMARKFNQVTELGKLMDPIADKLLMLGALIVASILSEMPWWVTILFLIREVGITVMRLAIVDKGGSVMAAEWPGKLKTLFQSVGIAFLLIPASTLMTAGSAGLTAYVWCTWIFILVALVLCLYSGAEYVIKAIRR